VHFETGCWRPAVLHRSWHSAVQLRVRVPSPSEPPQHLTSCMQTSKALCASLPHGHQPVYPACAGPLGWHPFPTAMTAPAEVTCKPSYPCRLSRYHFVYSMFEARVGCGILLTMASSDRIAQASALATAGGSGAGGGCGVGARSGLTPSEEFQNGEQHFWCCIRSDD
jgi:hypothetical protein